MRLALVQYSSNFSGSTISGRMIAQFMLARGWDVDVYFGFDGPFVDRLREDGCSADVVEHRNWLRSPGFFRFLRNALTEQRAATGFDRAFGERKPDVVYLNTLASYAAARAAKKMNLPVVLHVRELFSDEHGELNWPARWFRPLLRRHIADHSTKVVVNSDAVRANVFGTETSLQVENVPNAVAPEFFSPRGDQKSARVALGLRAAGPIVGVPGTLRLMKGHQFLFDAVPQILKSYPDCHFVVTGALGSSFGDQLVRRVEQMGLAGCVTFTGAIKDMLTFYHACDIACVPSLAEPFGRTAIECLATRTPLVATAVGGLAEIVRHGENGLLVQYGDTDGLAESIVSLLDDDELRDHISRRGRRDADQKYTEELYVNRIYGVIENIVAGSRNQDEA